MRVAEFNLSDPGAREAALEFLKGPDAHAAIREMLEYLRSERKHGSHPPTARTALDEVWDRFHSILQDRGITLA